MGAATATYGLNLLQNKNDFLSQFKSSPLGTPQKQVAITDKQLCNELKKIEERVNLAIREKKHDAKHWHGELCSANLAMDEVAKKANAETGKYAVFYKNKIGPKETYAYGLFESEDAAKMIADLKNQITDNTYGLLGTTKYWVEKAD